MMVIKFASSCLKRRSKEMSDVAIAIIVAGVIISWGLDRVAEAIMKKKS